MPSKKLSDEDEQMLKQIVREIAVAEDMAIRAGEDLERGEAFVEKSKQILEQRQAAVAIARRHFKIVAEHVGLMTERQHSAFVAKHRPAPLSSGLTITAPGTFTLNPSGIVYNASAGS